MKTLCGAALRNTSLNADWVKNSESSGLIMLSFYIFYIFIFIIYFIYFFIFYIYFNYVVFSHNVVCPFFLSCGIGFETVQAAGSLASTISSWHRWKRLSDCYFVQRLTARGQTEHSWQRGHILCTAVKLPANMWPMKVLGHRPRLRVRKVASSVPGGVWIVSSVVNPSLVIDRLEMVLNRSSRFVRWPLKVRTKENVQAIMQHSTLLQVAQGILMRFGGFFCEGC